jgi:hypothetical protein
MMQTSETGSGQLLWLINSNAFPPLAPPGSDMFKPSRNAELQFSADPRIGRFPVNLTASAYLPDHA